MARTRVPVVEGWFAMPPDDVPIPADGSGLTGYPLIGTRCTGSGTYFFPPERVMSRAPGFADAELEEVQLSDRGTLWSYTDARYQPPEPFVPATDPYEPVCLAAVELERERMVVLGQVVAGVTVDDLRVGMEMELVLDTLSVEPDPDGGEGDTVEYVVWKWRPAGATGEGAQP